MRKYVVFLLFFFSVKGFFVKVTNLVLFSTLVVRIARPKSLAIWHRGCSHRRPNRGGSPNRRHFASLDLKKTPRFFASQANIAGFSQKVFLAFSCDFRSSECVFASLAKKKLFRIASDLGMCDSSRIAHRGCIARFGALSFQRYFSHSAENTIKPVVSGTRGQEKDMPALELFCLSFLTVFGRPSFLPFWRFS